MKIIIIIAVGLGVYLLLLLIFQLIDILNLKKQNLKEQSILPSPKKDSQEKTDTTPNLPSSILGKTKTTICQNERRLDSSCQASLKTEEFADKHTTFVEQKSSEVPEQVEYEVDLPANEEEESSFDIDCFEPDKTNEIPCGVLNKDLAQLNRLISKEKLTNTEEETALTVVEKIDQTDFFDQLVEQFEKGKGKTLLSGLREKIKERELAESKTTVATVATTTAKKSGSIMTDKELEAYL